MTTREGGRSRRGPALPGASARPRPPAPPARSLSLHLKHHSTLRPACSAPGRPARTAGLDPARPDAAAAKHRLVAGADRTEPSFYYISCKGAGQRCCKGAGQRRCGGKEGAAARPPNSLALPFPTLNDIQARVRAARSSLAPMTAVTTRGASPIHLWPPSGRRVASVPPASVRAGGAQRRPLPGSKPTPQSHRPFQCSPSCRGFVRLLSG